MPEVVERSREDDRERAEPHEREAELRAEGSDLHLAAAHRTAGHRGHGGDEGGDTPEDHAAVQEQVREAPERVPSHDPMPRDVPRRAEPAEKYPRDADDEGHRRPQTGEPGAPERQRDRRHTDPILRTGLQQLDPGALLANGQSGNDDPPSRMALPPHREPARTEPRDAAQLAPVDRLRGRDERSGPARFHLDEDVAIAVAADEIDLPEAGSFVTGNDA